MHVKEIYVIFIHLFDSGILLIIDLNKKKGKRGEGGIIKKNISSSFRLRSNHDSKVILYYIII